jgi:hypothetical protein
MSLQRYGLTRRAYLIKEKYRCASDQVAHLRTYAGANAESVLAFCKKHDIGKEVHDAVKLAKQVFESQDIGLECDVDPETGDESIVIAITIRNKTGKKVA